MGLSDSLAITVMVPACPFRLRGSGPERTGPSLPLRVMVRVWVAGTILESRVVTSADCAQIVEPSITTVASIKADGWTILDDIGILLL
jgi:hypothetical protein